MLSRCAATKPHAVTCFSTSVSRGEAIDPVTQINEATGGWRAFFDYRPDGDDPAEIRCFLRSAGAALTETWSYLWTA